MARQKQRLRVRQKSDLHLLVEERMLQVSCFFCCQAFRTFLRSSSFMTTAPDSDVVKLRALICLRLISGRTVGQYRTELLHQVECQTGAAGTQGMQEAHLGVESTPSSAAVQSCVSRV